MNGMLNRCLLGLFIIALFGCGGLMNDEFGPDSSYEITPVQATVAPSGTVTVVVTTVNIAVISYHYSVKGSNAGSIMQHVSEPNKATYTAPDIPGTYKVVAGFKELTGKTYERTITMTVQAPE